MMWRIKVKLSSVCSYVQIGDRVVPLNEVTDEMVKQMDSVERERYQRVFQQAYNDFY